MTSGRSFASFFARLGFWLKAALVMTENFIGGTENSTLIEKYPRIRWTARSRYSSILLISR
jgi:hypothetical protein